MNGNGFYMLGRDLMKPWHNNARHGWRKPMDTQHDSMMWVAARVTTPIVLRKDGKPTQASLKARLREVERLRAEYERITRHEPPRRFMRIA